MSGMTRREYIFTQWPDCAEFARTVLHLNVDARGRAKSLNGQSGRGNEALVLDREVWYDHKLNKGGTVIDLCAWGMFNGDIGQAMNYLAGNFYDVDQSEWRNTVNEIRRNVDVWHEKLLPDDREYLHTRRITDETIERLKLGSMTSDATGKYPRKRLVIPYFQNGEIVYYITRDRLDGGDGQPKYMKCKLPKEKDSAGHETRQDKEVLQNLPWGLWTLKRKNEAGQVTMAEHGFKKRDWLIIAEGAFDAMSFEQEGYCVLGTMGGHFAPSAEREALGWCKRFPNVLVIFDNDPAGGAFQKAMCKKLFARRVHFYTVTVPHTFEGKAVKDVSDYYTAGGDLADFIDNAEEGLQFLASTLADEKEAKEFLYQTARFAQKSDVFELFQLMKERKIFNPFWLKMVFEEAIKAPAEPVIMKELEEAHNLRYVEKSSFFEYQHGVWTPISDNRVKSYADELLGRYSCNARMQSVMKFAQARLSVDDPMNAQPVINLLNGVLLTDEGCRLVKHDPSYLSTIQLAFPYDSEAKCPLWEKFLIDTMNGDKDKIMLLQEIGGYGFWPDNGLEKCFFLIGDGGNGKGVFMDTIKAVYGKENCSALPLSSFGGQFDPIMLQYSLVNFASETRVDLRGNIESIKAVTSGDEIVAAHKGVDAIKFTPRCKLITSCNDFFNTGDITHALLRRMCFVKFNNNFVQKRQANVFLRDELRKELPGILNWCIQGYLRLKDRASRREPDIFTPTTEDREQKREFMRTTNPVAFFIEERLMDKWDERQDTHELYSTFKVFAETYGYKALSLGAFTNRIKRVMRELRPEVRQEERRHHTWLVFPPAPKFEDLDKE